MLIYIFADALWQILWTGTGTIYVNFMENLWKIYGI